MGKYHPHGNLAVYDALVRLAQDWSLRYSPLIFGHWWEISAPSMEILRRPTVTPKRKLAQVATSLLEDLDKVDC